MTCRLRDRLQEKFERLKADPYDPRYSNLSKAETIKDRRESVFECFFASRTSISSLWRLAHVARFTSAGSDHLKANGLRWRSKSPTQSVCLNRCLIG